MIVQHTILPHQELLNEVYFSGFVARSIPDNLGKTAVGSVPAWKDILSVTACYLSGPSLMQGVSANFYGEIEDPAGLESLVEFYGRTVGALQESRRHVAGKSRYLELIEQTQSSLFSNVLSNGGRLAVANLISLRDSELASTLIYPKNFSVGAPDMLVSNIAGKSVYSVGKLGEMHVSMPYLAAENDSIDNFTAVFASGLLPRINIFRQMVDMCRTANRN